MSVICSWKPSPTDRVRITDSLASTYTVPVPDTRKKRVWKYCRSSVERLESRLPSTVSTHFERNRVSHAKRPVGSVGDGSMSPHLSETTNVFPSRMLTWESLMVTSCGRCRPVRPDAASKKRCGRVDGTVDDAVEDRPLES